MNAGPTHESAGIFDPPPAFRELAERLESAGYEAWAVGGAIRNALSRRTSSPPTSGPRSDWDLATSARPEETQRLFGHTVPIGVEHGTVGVLGPDQVLYEVTTFRRDVRTDGRHAEVEFSDSIEEDLARRDFTINAIAWRVTSGELLDPFDGSADLKIGRLRSVGDAGERFSEDYLRVLRGIRFSGGHGFEMEAATESALRAAVPYIDRLSAERVREELLKTLGVDRPSPALRMYGEMGVLEIWYPEVAGASARDDWDEHLVSVDHIKPHRRLLRVARFCMSEGEPDQQVDRATALLGRLRFSNADLRAVAAVIEAYWTLPGPTDSDASMREWLSESEGAWRDVIRVHAAAARTDGRAERSRFVTHVWRRLRNQCVSGAPLHLADLNIGGEDLLDLGVPEGPALGLLLEELHAEVLEDPELNERDRLIELARELISIAGLAPDPDP